MSKVSVIVPVYNTELYIRQCLESLLAQTLTDIEIILVDDGSSDNSPIICDDYAKKDSRIKVIHQENMGLSKARQNGLDASCGEYVTHIDSDDYVNEDYLKKLYEIAKENDLDIAVAQLKTFRENKISDGGIFPGDKIYTSLDEKLFMLRNDIHTYWTSVVNKIFSRRLIQIMDNHKNPPNLNVGEDCLWMIKASYFANKTGTAANSFYYYRYNPKSLTHVCDSKMIEDKDTASKAIIDFMNKYNFSKNCVEIVFDNCLWHNLFDSKKIGEYIKLTNYKDFYNKSIFNLQYIKYCIKYFISLLKYKLTFGSKREKRKQKYRKIKNNLKLFSN